MISARPGFPVTDTIRAAEELIRLGAQLGQLDT
jgi:hypothetical protein